MSNVNYSLNHKGVRLISSDDAWVKGKNGKMKLNSSYSFVGKIDKKILPNEKLDFYFTLEVDEKRKTVGFVSAFQRFAKNANKG